MNSTGIAQTHRWFCQTGGIALKVTTVLCFLVCTGCFYGSPAYRLKKAVRAGDCARAYMFWQQLKLKKQKLKWAKKAWPLCVKPYAPKSELSKSELSKSDPSKSNLKVALAFFSFLGQWSMTEKERLFFKKKQADVAFQTKNYEQALLAYSFLKNRAIRAKDKYFYTFRTAISYFERGKWQQTLKEVDFLLKNPSHLPPVRGRHPTGGQGVKGNPTKNNPPPTYLEVLFLKARTLLMQASYGESIKLFQKIRALNPTYFKEQEMFLYLAFIYEAQNNFNQALLELKNFKSSSLFLDQKIKRLKIRKSRQAGSAWQAL